MVTEAVIGRIRFLAPGVAHAGTDHAFQTPKLGVRSPESTQGERRRFEVRRHGGVDRGNRQFVFS
jgi:hypothetical protein